MNRGTPPVAVGLGASFKSLNEEVLGGRGPGTSIHSCEALCSATPSGGIQALPSLFEFAGVEARRVVEDGSLARVEVDELLVVEVVEAAREVAVGLEACVVPRGPGLWP